MVCDDDGQVLCEETEVRKRWRDHFVMLLQRIGQPQQEVLQGGVYREEALEETNEEEISVEEVCTSIARLKSKKAPSVCGITGEMIKASGKVTVRWMHSIVNMAWKTGTVPEDWRKALVIQVGKYNAVHKLL